MTKKSFLLVSLQENRAKELAQVISNDSCRRILDYLSEKQDATESDLAKKLNIPISTIHYNLKHLIKAGIITVDEFHYSEKGKEVNHYKLANKYIIIAPKTTYGIKEKLKSILPVSLLALAGATIIQFYTKYFKQPVFGAMKTSQAVIETAQEAAPQVAPLMDKAVEEGSKAVIGKAPETVQNIVQTTPNYALWFLLGCLFVIVLMVIIELINSKRK